MIRVQVVALSVTLTHFHDPCAGGGTLLHLFGPPDPGNQFLLQDQEQCQQGDLIFTPLLQYSSNIILLYFHCKKTLSDWKVKTVERIHA
jgi:hypothetical protein